MSTQPFSLSTPSPASNTLVKRVWKQSETPPGTYYATFSPDSASDRLRGTPTWWFTNHNPQAGEDLQLAVTPPQTHGDTLTYNVDVTVNGGVSVSLTFDLEYE